ncbi:MAG TPA: acyl-CoA dehydrogenase family protein [Dehalococcoidia bacterium]|nr:acyl-CoA dehydrogenase family protein [Dehalococcoidia bacterium]
MATETTSTQKPFFPSGRQEKRRVLLEAVESVRGVAEAHADEAEASGALHPEVVHALTSTGLFRLKLPAELGGAEADPVTQLDVIEAMTYIDTSAGWAVMIGATSVGWPGAYLPDAAIATVFAGGRVPHVAGTGGIGGNAVVADGGYRLTGRFPFASGIRYADWLIAGSRVQRVEGEPPEGRFFIFPVADAIVHEDSWDVAGLKGSSSNDFSVEDLFVPEAFTWDRGLLVRGEPLRGGPIFRLGMPAFTSNEHLSFALGAARRALALVIELASSKRRGPSQNPIAERPVFQRFVSTADLRLRAARARAVECLEEAWQCVCRGQTPEPRLQAEIRATSVYVTEECIDVATQAFRYAGGGALQSSNLLQRIWRDITASGQHVAVNDEGYEEYGRHLLGIAAPLPANPGISGGR